MKYKNLELLYALWGDRLNPDICSDIEDMVEEANKEKEELIKYERENADEIMEIEMNLYRKHFL